MKRLVQTLLIGLAVEETVRHTPLQKLRSCQCSLGLVEEHTEHSANKSGHRPSLLLFPFPCCLEAALYLGDDGA
jgi:hypothetical protein